MGQVTYVVVTLRHNVAAAYFSEESYVNYFFTAVRTKSGVSVLRI
jgi:hypothetical protein